MDIQASSVTPKPAGVSATFEAAVSTGRRANTNQLNSQDVSTAAAAVSAATLGVRRPSSISSSSPSQAGNVVTIGDYIVASKIGYGSFATVYKGYHAKDPSQIVAIKAIKKEKLKNAKLSENLQSEISIMKELSSHPNIVKLYDVKYTEKYIYLIMEYCAGGDLQVFIKKFKRLREEVAQKLFRQLAQGIGFLWSKNLIHRDLKPQNLLLSESSEDAILKIADFGFARHLETQSLADTLCGSPLYMAPEILSFKKYDAKADLWSVGTILFEMIVGKPPFGGANHVQLLANIERNELRFPKEINVGQDCLELLQGLLRRTPTTRISFEDFFNSSFVHLDVASTLMPEMKSSSLEELKKECAATSSSSSSGATITDVPPPLLQTDFPKASGKNVAVVDVQPCLPSGEITREVAWKEEAEKASSSSSLLSSSSMPSFAETLPTTEVTKQQHQQQQHQQQQQLQQSRPLVWKQAPSADVSPYFQNRKSLVRNALPDDENKTFPVKLDRNEETPAMFSQERPTHHRQHQLHHQQALDKVDQEDKHPSTLSRMEAMGRTEWAAPFDESHRRRRRTDHDNGRGNSLSTTNAVLSSLAAAAANLAATTDTEDARTRTTATTAITTATATTATRSQTQTSGASVASFPPTPSTLSGPRTNPFKVVPESSSLLRSDGASSHNSILHQHFHSHQPPLASLNPLPLRPRPNNPLPFQLQNDDQDRARTRSSLSGYEPDEYVVVKKDLETQPVGSNHPLHETVWQASLLSVVPSTRSQFINYVSALPPPTNAVGESSPGGSTLYIESIGHRAQAVAALADKVAVLGMSVLDSVAPAQHFGHPSDMLVAEEVSSSSLHEESDVGSRSNDGAALHGGKQGAPLSPSKMGYFLEAFSLYMKSLNLFCFAIQETQEMFQTLAKNRQDIQLQLQGTLQSQSEVQVHARNYHALVALQHWLGDQFARCLERLEQCHERLASSSSKEPFYPCEDILYKYALQLGREAAVKEILGQKELCREMYIQALLLLETLMMHRGLEERDRDVIHDYLVSFLERIQFTTVSDAS